MNIEKFTLTTNPPTNEFEKDIERSLDKYFEKIRQILNKGLRLEDNFDNFKTTITTSATPGQETAIAHGLKRVPLGIVVLEADKAAQIFLGPSGKNATTYNVQSDIASVTATILVF